MVRILGRCSLRGAGLRAKYRPYRRCEGLKARQGPFMPRDSRPYFAVQDPLIVLPSASDIRLKDIDGEYEYGLVEMNAA